MTYVCPNTGVERTAIDMHKSGSGFHYWYCATCSKGDGRREADDRDEDLITHHARCDNPRLFRLYIDGGYRLLSNMSEFQVFAIIGTSEPVNVKWNNDAMRNARARRGY